MNIHDLLSIELAGLHENYSRHLSFKAKIEYWTTMYRLFCQVTSKQHQCMHPLEKGGTF